MSALSDLPVVAAFGDLPTPPGVDVVGLDLPVGRLTAYRALPDGPTRGVVLIVPGYTGSKEDFRTFVPGLRARGWATVVISRRGQADSVAPDDLAAYTLDEEAADVVRAARAIDGGRPVHLVGHSLGGVIVRAAAIAAPDAFRSVTMLCSGPHGWAHRKYLERHLVPEHGNAALFDAMNPATLGVPDDALPADERFLRMRMSATSPQSIVGGGGILEDPSDTTDELRDTGLPLLVAHGEHDDAWPIPWQRDMADRLHAEYAVIPGGHHSPQIDAADATLSVLDGFLRTASASADATMVG